MASQAGSRIIESFRAVWEPIVAHDITRNRRQTFPNPTPVPEADLTALERKAGRDFRLPAEYRAFMAAVGTAPGWPLHKPSCQSSGRYDIMALPFPFVRAFDDAGAVEDAVNEAFEARLAGSLDPAVARESLRAFRNYGAENGTISLCEDTVLVVSGAERGRVWFLMDVSYGTKVAPLGASEYGPLKAPLNGEPVDFGRFVDLVLILHVQSLCE